MPLELGIASALFLRVRCPVVWWCRAPLPVTSIPGHTAAEAMPAPHPVLGRIVFALMVGRAKCMGLFSWFHSFLGAAFFSLLFFLFGCSCPSPAGDAGAPWPSPCMRLGFLGGRFSILSESSATLTSACPTRSR